MPIDVGGMMRIGFRAWAILLNTAVRHYKGFLVSNNPPWTLGDASPNARTGVFGVAVCAGFSRNHAAGWLSRAMGAGRPDEARPNWRA